MNKQRWTREECPYPIPKARRRPYEQIHDIIGKWEDLKEDEKQMLIEVKKVIASIIGDRKVKLFGSRINGSWLETSDWDLIVFGDPPTSEVQNMLRTYNYGVKIDLQFRTMIAQDSDLDIFIP